MTPRYVLRRLAQAVVTVVGVVVVAFVLIHLAPGDAADTLSEGAASGDYAVQLRERMGLDRPLPEQLGTYVTQVLRGDLGDSSVQSGRSVASLIGEHLPRTLLLMGPVVVLSSAVGVALALRAAKKPNGALDRATSVAALLGFGIPGFWLGQMAILVLALQLRLFPVGGMTDVRVSPTGFDRVVDVGIHMSLPVLVLAAAEVAMVFRVTRAGILQERRKDYVRTAVAKGVPADRALSHHALRNALLPLATILGARVAFLFSGTVLIERLFVWPGVGTLLINATAQRDRPLVVGIVLMVAFTLVSASLIADLVYARIDPRIRYD